MRRRLRWAGLKQYTIVAVVTLASALFTFLILSAPNRRQAKVVSAPSQKIDFSEVAGNPNEHDISSALLLDSILSIIQSYYVDDDRITNQNILQLTLDTLESSGQIEIERADDRVTLRSGNFSYQFLSSESIQYDAMLEVMIGLSRLLDRTATERSTAASASHVESNGSHIVLNALLSTLDAHSSLLTKDSYRELKQGTEGTFGGLGVLVGIREKVLTVIKPLPRSPASRHGISKNDRILAINGIDTFGSTLDQLVEYMRGEPGTSVRLKMLPNGAVAGYEMDLKREVIRVDSVTATAHPFGNSHALRLQIESFSSRTAHDVLAEINKFRRGHGGQLPGLILDLRSNPGGLLDQAVDVADIFLPAGVIVATKGRRQEIESAASGLDEVNFPIVVLINNESASASEIVAGALQDHGRAVIIGQQSFGKGSVQTVFELPGEQALKLTIARYYTPLGRSIQNIGITPNIRIQPVYRQKTNSNLLGSYRYKNEEFLANHLKSQISTSGVKNRSHDIEQFAGYYLAANLESDEEVALENDRDLQMALEIIHRVYKTYGSVLPEEAARASHWLALSADGVKAILDGWDKEVQSFLKESFAIDWAKVDGEIQDGLILEIDGNIEKVVTPGSVVNLRYEIRNKSTQPATRVSIFMRDESLQLSGKENLIGSVPANSSAKGVFPLEIPAYVQPGDATLDFGLAVSAKISTSPLRRVKLPIRARTIGQIELTANLLDEPGGKVPGSLEAGEKGSIAVAVRNYGAVDAREITLQLTNLSGTQISLDSHVETIPSLKPGEEAVLHFGVEGGGRLYSEEFSIGATASSRDLNSDVNQKFDFSAIAARVAKIEGTMSH